MIKILFRSSDFNCFIALCNDEFWMVSFIPDPKTDKEVEKATKANDPKDPYQFLKWGYFVDAGKLPKATIDRIRQIIENTIIQMEINK